MTDQERLAKLAAECPAIDWNGEHEWLDEPAMHFWPGTAMCFRCEKSRPDAEEPCLGPKELPCLGPKELPCLGPKELPLEWLVSILDHRHTDWSIEKAGGNYGICCLDDRGWVTKQTLREALTAAILGADSRKITPPV